MTPLRKGLLLLLVGFLLGFASGCATQPSAPADATLIQGVLDKLLPADFVGPAHLDHTNQYFAITIDAGNVHRDAAGRWTWDWLTYERTSHFPIFYGLTWASTGRVRMGSVPPPALPRT